MKEFLAIWISAQLLLIGISGVSTHNEIVRGQFECLREGESVPLLIGAAVPLMFFTNQDITEKVKEYCQNRNQGEL